MFAWNCKNNQKNITMILCSDTDGSLHICIFGSYNITSKQDKFRAVIELEIHICSTS